MPLYISQFVIAEEDIWFDKVAPYEVARMAVRYRVHMQLFSATGAENAYARASEMTEGFSDANCDGPGDRKNFRCIGIHQLDEIFLGGTTLDEALAGPYGVDVGTLQYADHAPAIPSRNALSLFRFPA